jgi:hypothetical protein
MVSCATGATSFFSFDLLHAAIAKRQSAADIERVLVPFIFLSGV